jgi:hypothetical protein
MSYISNFATTIRHAERAVEVFRPTHRDPAGHRREPLPSGRGKDKTGRGRSSESEESNQKGFAKPGGPMLLFETRPFSQPAISSDQPWSATDNRFCRGRGASTQSRDPLLALSNERTLSAQAVLEDRLAGTAGIANLSHSIQPSGGGLR